MQLSAHYSEHSSLEIGLKVHVAILAGFTFTFLLAALDVTRVYFQNSVSFSVFENPTVFLSYFDFSSVSTVIECSGSDDVTIARGCDGWLTPEPVNL